MNLNPKKTCDILWPWASLIIFLVQSCAPLKKSLWKDEQLKTDDLEDEPTQGLEWNGLISQTQVSTHNAFYPYQTSGTPMSVRVSGKKEVAKKALFPQSDFNPATYPEFVSTLDNLKPFFGGYVGLRGNSRIFALESSGNPQKFSDMFPVTIQVLSREYGCFVKKGIYWPDQHLFSCRDKRNIMVWYQPVLGWSRLVFRQFDHFGYEIKVRAHVIQRISDRQILAYPLKPDSGTLTR